MNRQHRWVLLCALLARAAGAQADPPGLDRLLRRTLDQWRHDDPFPGVTMAFILPDGTSGAVASGIASPNAHMLSGSIGKTYVATILLELIGEGRIALSDHLERYLGGEPWYPHLPNGHDITIESLMHHTSGLLDHAYDPRFEADLVRDPAKWWTPAELVRYDLDQPPLGPVGTVYRYSDTNYILLGMVIEQVIGHPYYQELNARLLAPLGLHDTRPSNDSILPLLIDGYTAPDNPYGLPVHVASHGRNVLNPQVEWTGGGLLSNASDIARWGRALYSGQVLTPTLLSLMLADTAAGKHNPAYGLGVYEWQTPLGRAYGHQGDYPGYWSVLLYFPRYGLTIAMQFNTDDEHVLHGRPLRYAQDLAARIVAAAHLQPVSGQ